MNVKKSLILSSLLTLFLQACGSDKPSIIPEEPEEPKPGEVTVYTTTSDRSQELKKTLISFSTGSNMSPRTITLNESVTYQTMDGFGTAVTGSSAYNLLKMSATDRSKFLKETFSTTDGYGHSYIRIAIGCSDFSLSEYTLNDEPGIEHFALQEEETQFVIPVLKEILAINPHIKILGSPWTAPRWMKVNNLTSLAPHNSWTGGHLNPAYYQDYATYFVKWIQAMDAQGIKIYGITPQNEPLNPGNSASMLMYWEEQQAFVRDALGPKMKEAGLQTKIYAFDHNYNYDNIASQNDYPIQIFSDPQAAQYFAGSAYHNYGGDKAELLDIRSKAPNKELVFTETSIGTWNDGRNLSRRLLEDMKEVGLGTINNWCRGVIVWNLMLDGERGPNRDGGCQTCYGAVDINASNYKTITRNSHYYVISHLSAVIQPGAVRIGAQGFDDRDIMYAVFKNPDNSYAVVLANDKNEASRVTIADGKNHFSYEIPAKSVVSYNWKK